MTQMELIQLGFKKKKLDSAFWYELKCRKHVFITNDTLFNNNKDKWFVGYENKTTQPDPFWFNQNLSGVEEFKIIFHVITGVGFKLAHQRKLIK